MARSTATARRSVGHSALVPAAIATALMAVQAAAGLAFPSVYRDVGFALDAWRVNDPVTALLATPVALVSLALAWRGSLRASLVLLGTMQYALYNYAFYLFGAALNAHFLLYAAAVVASAWALIAGLMALDAATVGRTGSGRVPPSLPARPLAGYLAFWAGLLGVVWVAQAIGFAATGEVPAMGGEVFRLIAALDLTLVVAPVTVAAVWLWRRRMWGANLAVVLHVKGAIYALLLAIGSALGGPLAQGGGDGLLALWAVFAAGSAVSLVVLLRHVRDAP